MCNLPEWLAGVEAEWALPGDLVDVARDLYRCWIHPALAPLLLVATVSSGTRRLEMVLWSEEGDYQHGKVQSELIDETDGQADSDAVASAAATTVQ